MRVIKHLYLAAITLTFPVGAKAQPSVGFIDAPTHMIVSLTDEVGGGCFPYPSRTEEYIRKEAARVGIPTTFLAGDGVAPV